MKVNDEEATSIHQFRARLGILMALAQSEVFTGQILPVIEKSSMITTFDGQSLLKRQ